MLSFLYCICEHIVVLQSVLWRADDSFWKFILIFCCGFQGLNSDCLTWLQVPFPIVSSHLHSDHHAMICKADSFLTYECMHAFFAAFDSIYGLWTAVKWVVYKSVGWLLQPSYNLITLLYILMSTHCLKDNTSFVFSLGTVITITTLIFHFIFFFNFRRRVAYRIFLLFLCLYFSNSKYFLVNSRTIYSCPWKFAIQVSREICREFILYLTIKYVNSTYLTSVSDL